MLNFDHNDYTRIECCYCNERTGHWRQIRVDGRASGDERLILECEVCHRPRFVEVRGQDGAEVFLHPLPSRYQVPSWAHQLPEKLQLMLTEVHGAMNSGLYWSATLGLRSVIDAFALDRIGDVGGFKSKLSKLEAQGFLSSRDIESLTTAIELGHDATHRMKIPGSEDCVLALKIVMHLLQRYEVEHDADALRVSRGGG